MAEGFTKRLFAVIFVAGLVSIGVMGLLAGHHGSSGGHILEAEADSGSSLPTQAIGFQETGLAKGTSWSVTIQTQAQVSVGSGGTTHYSSSDKIVFNLIQGSYNAKFYATGPYISPGTYGISVASTSYTLKVPFRDMFTVNVTWTGAPKSISPGIALSGSSTTDYLNQQIGELYASSGNTVSKLAVNGTYRVMFGETLPNGAELFGYIGNTTVNGTGVNLAVEFHEVNLSASGLPQNVSWGFHGYLAPDSGYYPPNELLPGLPRNATVYLPTGSTFLQPVAKGYYNPGFYINVTGQNVSRTIHFQKEYPVRIQSNFQVFPDGSQWGLNGILYTFDGSPYIAQSAASFELYVPNGTYHLSPWVQSSGVMLVNGSDYYLSFTYNMSKSNITVNGNSQVVNVTFNLTYTPQKGNAGNGILPYVVLGGIIAAGISIAGVAFYVRKKG